MNKLGQQQTFVQDASKEIKREFPLSIKDTFTKHEHKNSTKEEERKRSAQQIIHDRLIIRFNTRTARIDPKYQRPVWQPHPPEVRTPTRACSPSPPPPDRSPPQLAPHQPALLDPVRRNGNTGSHKCLVRVTNGNRLIQSQNARIHPVLIGKEGFNLLQTRPEDIDRLPLRLTNLQSDSVLLASSADRLSSSAIFDFSLSFSAPRESASKRAKARSASLRSRPLSLRARMPLSSATWDSARRSSPSPQPSLHDPLPI
ncbi:unnamed protein product [Microthlaspi erraticum]|uniref:Uncharacterized protein n=1 Tax=Microthlaspi erraticum TaxID=1685480 RepID=A0A6D2I5N0_9BRAS|nr:unnamed protein product [Microthlaspi erraticum]